MDRIIIGWREWAVLPELNIQAVKVKIDTGARTSALHAVDIETFHADGRHQVRFAVYPLVKRTDIKVQCVADVVDQRVVRDSGGHEEKRLVIRTPFRIGTSEWPIEITLTNRETMRFRMLLGRVALQNRVFIDPAKSYLQGKTLKNTYQTIYPKSGYNKPK